MVAAWNLGDHWLPVAIIHNDGKLASDLRKRGLWKEYDFAVVSFNQAAGAVWKAGARTQVQL